MIDVEEWAEIRRLHRAEGMSIKAIMRWLPWPGTRSRRHCALPRSSAQLRALGMRAAL